VLFFFLPNSWFSYRQSYLPFVGSNPVGMAPSRSLQKMVISILFAVTVAATANDASVTTAAAASVFTTINAIVSAAPLANVVRPQCYLPLALLGTPLHPPVLPRLPFYCY
jgi:hypothetical protein